MRIATCFLLLVAACTTSSTSTEPYVCDDCVEQTCESYDPLRRPLFGDTHVHTALSYDANVRGTRLGHEDAYRFARGEPIGIQPYDEQGKPLRTIQRDRPLDWVVISDHAEYLGTVAQCTDPAQPGYNHPQCELYRGDPLESFASFGLITSQPPDQVAYPELCGEGGEYCLQAGVEVWGKIQDDAAAAHDASSSCEFSALLGYEWTPNPNSNNLHRNVIFRNEVVPNRAVGYFDETYVEGLWRHLRTECIDAGTQCDALTIPHNSNLSAGTFFQPLDQNGDPIDADYAEERAFMEPLFEIYQHKGDSECLPGQTISDELCGFEKLPYANFASITVNIFTDPHPSDFLRAALGQGMQLELSLGANPFKHGIVASTDTHIAAPGHTPERGYAGHGNVGKGATATEFETGLVDYPDNSGGGLAVVWAEENSREAIFSAMRRKETYGTSGPHITVRFFGGWSYPGNMCDDPSFATIGYQRGVPMGGDLPAPPDGGAPTFFLSAIQDPGTEETIGTPLQRIQIIKGWLDEAGEYHAETFDVGGNPDNGASVDLATCEPQPGTGGFTELCAIWTDPSFDSGRPAFYYARVIENPV
ncbi:MAG: DUF3604 domain-containing protein, partial [Gemmatimonadales bacterium]